MAEPLITFLPYQKRWLDDRSRFKIGMFARQTGKTFTLYTSTNLVNWTKLTSLANPIGTLQYQSSSTNPQVYYKVSQP